MEQVKTILKSLSLKQQKEPELGEPNDRIAFLQSGRVNDKILRIHEERGSVNGDTKVESEVNSPSNGEDTDEMPPLTDSDESDIERKEEFPPMPPLTNSEPSNSESEVGKEDDRKHQGSKYRNVKRKVLRKKKSREDSDLVLDSSDDSQGTSSDLTTEDDYSDDDHVFLVSSVANLRRRELMNLVPMKTKSKKTYKTRVTPLKSIDKDPVLSLKATKEIIDENLKLDERNLKLRSPKRHLLSEEKWGEGSTWDDIISEGKDREKELALQTLSPKNVTKSDKAMTLQVPGSEPSEPIIKEKPPPIGYVRKLIEPNGG